MTRAERVKAAIAEFPGTFGLRAFPGKRFTLNESASYVADSGAEVMLYVFTADGQAFCKGTPAELRKEVRP